MYGASGDAHLRSEVSGACRGLSFVLEALWRICRVHIYRHLRAELLQRLREFFFFCESSLLRTNHSTLQRGMLHTAAEGGTATEGDRGGEGCWGG